MHPIWAAAEQPCTHLPRDGSRWASHMLAADMLYLATDIEAHHLIAVAPLLAVEELGRCCKTSVQ